jgi:hypothetical protein
MRPPILPAATGVLASQAIGYPWPYPPIFPRQESAMLIRQFPALSAAIAQFIVAVILSFPVHLSLDETTAIEAVTVAALGLVVAAMTHPFAYSAVTGLLAAGLTCLLAFKTPGITPGLLSAVNGVIAVFAFKAVHRAVSPVIPVPPSPAEHAR